MHNTFLFKSSLYRHILLASAPTFFSIATLVLKQWYILILKNISFIVVYRKMPLKQYLKECWWYYHFKINLREARRLFWLLDCGYCYYKKKYFFFQLWVVSVSWQWFVYDDVCISEVRNNNLFMNTIWDTRQMFSKLQKNRPSL